MLPTVPSCAPLGAGVASAALSAGVAPMRDGGPAAATDGADRAARHLREDRLLRILGATHVSTACGIVLFWVGFYSGVSFPKEELAPRIQHFEGYYAWETSFTVPDGLLALVLLVGGVMLLRAPRSELARTLLMAGSGALIFLGVLDFVYDYSQGMYALGHWFSWTLLFVALTLPPLGLATVVLLHRLGPRSASEA